jgi:hypothetical protein
MAEYEINGHHAREREPRKGERLRRTVIVLTTMTVALVLGSGMAFAAAISGTQGDDRLRGTIRADQIYGLNGDDTLFGFAGRDELYGGAGNDGVNAGPRADEIYGGSGNDRLFGGDGRDFINSVDRRFDVVDCGNPDAARDRVVRDRNDRVQNCNRREVSPRPGP